MEESYKNKIVFIVGATASGKSSIAFDCASRASSLVEIVNMDSVQTYHGLDIGSAMPSLKERNSLPHHLFDFVEYDSELTAGKYLKLATEVIEDRLGTAHLLFVGGSGFYMQALDKGMYEGVSIPAETTLKLREELEALGYGPAYSWIKQQDPAYAEKINKNDHYRIQRAYEILKFSGKKVTEILAEQEERVSRYQANLPYSKVKVGVYLEKDQLLKQVRARIQAMLKNGFVEEVQSLLAKGYKGWNPLNSVGYKELVAYLHGDITLSKAEEQMVNSTMRLAKKQRTWLQRDKDIQWFHSVDERESCLHYLDTQLGVNS